MLIKVFYFLNKGLLCKCCLKNKINKNFLILNSLLIKAF